ncbi:MAG: DICT sensory domain-containing protein [Halorubrum sp.]
MSLIELIAGVEAREATLTVFDRDPEAASTLAEHFADRNVHVVAGSANEGPDGYAVLSRDGEFVTAVAVAELLPGYGDEDAEADDADRNDTAASGHAADPTPRRVGKPVLDHLDETMFTSYSRRDMVAASREIEDRAWRVGRGELHAGFQTLDVLTGETTTYDRLGEKTALDVHAYATAEGEPPDAGRYTVHVARSAEIRETWFVAYDGGGVDEAKCALLAEERAPGEFYGFWSYDPETVDTIVDYLTDRYWSSEATDDGDDGATV